MLKSKALMIFSTAVMSVGAQAVVCQADMVRQSGQVIQNFFGEGFDEAESCKEARKECSKELRLSQRSGANRNASCVLVGVVNTQPAPNPYPNPTPNPYPNPGNGQYGQYDYQLNEIEMLLSSTNWRARQMAAQDLTRYPSARALAIGIKAIADSDSDVRNSAINSVNQIVNMLDMYRESISVIKEMTPTLTRGTWQQRQMSAKILGQVTTAEAIIPLISAVGDSDSDVRNTAANSVNALLNSQDLKQVVMSNKLNMETLVTAVSWQVRQLAVKVIRIAATPRLIAIVVRATGDSDSDVRNEAIQAVKSLTQERNYTNLPMNIINELEDLYRSNSWQVRVQVIFALGETRNYMARNTIIRALDDSDSDVRNAARAALNKI